ncbi:hypothetical protein BVC93_13290 [Mycobacterium sp. MS1601]|uniref:hypothetical protein n=1 Tax=Mycobacterium sp. MS1601 TaxID=1936029 RepID=UPI00097943A9|nr:hypothetical protein [Mycobacterium sp. MS1601]AQA03231.1 hypothetical protein BVC93_13290 [Mycobacterium sp. MS1601]
MFLPVPAGSTVGGLITVLVAVVAVMVISAVWVYRDATASAHRGRPIISSVGSVQLKKPLVWSLAVLLLWEMCFPLYITSRNAA